MKKNKRLKDEKDALNKPLTKTFLSSLHYIAAVPSSFPRNLQ